MFSEGALDSCGRHSMTGLRGSLGPVPDRKVLRWLIEKKRNR